MADEQMTMAEYVKSRGLTLAILASVPDMSDDGWQHTRHTVRITRHHYVAHTEQLITSYRTGTGITAAPTVVDVMDALRSDAQAFASVDCFEDFAAEFGYDSDSRAAEKTYNACGRISRNLVKLLGEEDYLILLESVEPE